MRKTEYAAERYEELYDREIGEQEYAEAVKEKRVKVYRARSTRAGGVLDINIGAVWNAKGEAARAKAAKRAQNPEVIERRNERETERRIEGLLNANFGTGDLAIVLTFKDTETDPRKALRWYLGKLKKEMKAEGKELRYLYMIETADRDGEALRRHIHMFLPKEAGRERAEQLWRGRYGIANATRLEADENGLSGFAKYVQKAKRTVRKARRWAGSRNLKKPEVRRSVRLPGGKQLTKKLVYEIVSGQRDARQLFENAYKGWRLIRFEVRGSDYAAGVYLDVRMTRIFDGGGKR